jgi:hypothetical protein
MRYFLVAITGISAFASWFGKKSIEAFIMDKVVHVMTAQEEFLIEYGIPAVFALTCLYLLFRGRSKAVRGQPVNIFYVAAIVLGLAVIGLLLAGYIFDRKNETASIARDFSAAHESFPNLGNALGSIKISPNSYQAKHDRATVIWLKPLLTIYALSADGIFLLEQDDDWDGAAKYYDEKLLAERFKMPIGKAPFGGVAKHWESKPDNWSWIGPRQWHCSFSKNEIYYQVFEKGLILGVFRLSPGNFGGSNQEGQIFILLAESSQNRGSWRSRHSISPAPPCSPAS